MTCDVQIDTSRLAEVFDRYMEQTTRSVFDVLQGKARELSLRLFKATRALAPKKENIAALPAALNWRIKRPKGWAVFDKFEQRMRKRGKKKGTFRTVRVQKGEINRRLTKLGYTAVGWLPAVRITSRGGHTSGATVASLEKGPGGVEISLQGTEPFVRLWNRTPGAGVVESKHAIVQQCLNDLAAGMEQHMRDKQLEAALAAGFHGQ